MTTRGRTLVTGAGGRIGSVLTRHLVREGHPVTALSLDFREPCPADRTMQGDASDPAVLAEALTDVCQVVHLAAVADPSHAEPVSAFSTNVSTTFAVLHAAAEQGVRRIVLASSINAIGYPLNPHQPPLPALPLDEDTPPDVADWYSLAKQCDELTAKMIARRYEIPVVALRLPMVRWPEELRQEAELARQDPQPLAREGWSYLDVDDLAVAVSALLRCPLSPEATVLSLAAKDSLLGVLTGPAVDSIWPDTPVRNSWPIHQNLVSAARAEQLFGFAPANSVHDAPATS